MGKSKPFQAGVSRWLTGWLALCLLLLVNFKPAAINTALWLAVQHGHDHQIIVQTDGDHFDIRLSHDQDHSQSANNHDHESSLGWIVSLFSTHDHEGDDHVLHFNFSEAHDQIRQRNLIAAAPMPAQPSAITATSLIKPLSVSIPAATAIHPSTSPPLTAGHLGLRTTVLLI